MRNYGNVKYLIIEMSLETHMPTHLIKVNKISRITLKIFTLNH